MCGIFGMFVARNVAVPNIKLGNMSQVIHHRGPDGANAWCGDDRRFQVGFRRLAIIDLATSMQPFSDPQDRYVLAGNGEVYNFLELRKRFDGFQFKTEGDIETILAAKAALGDGYLHALNGMYAFALYDKHEHTLELVRDRVGVKPLYWTEVAKGVVLFASEIKSLLASGLVSASICGACGTSLFGPWVRAGTCDAISKNQQAYGRASS